MYDALVIGSGPAGLAIASALCREGLQVQGLSPTPPTTPWVNTYGIWCDELEPLGLTHLLGHRWSDCWTHVSHAAIPLQRDYGLFDKTKLQTYLLEACGQFQMAWRMGLAQSVEHYGEHSRLTTQDGAVLTARLIIDASGHKPVLVQRPSTSRLAYQAAYGIVGRFSKPPVDSQQMVLMDFRADHLSPAERRQPPTFLYAMDLGKGVYFVEETSLAYSPAISFEVLEKRLYQRLAHRGIDITEIRDVERCLFPMNLPLPDLQQSVMGFGGAASMVHPASGYLVGATLRRAPEVARAIAQTLNSPHASPAQTAQAAWQALWPPERLRKHYLYLFGLENLMQFDEQQTHNFFATFFNLPQSQWAGFLADSLTMPELIRAMLGLFAQAPHDVRWGLMQSIGSQGHWLWKMVQV